jgi:hypothetical protein
MSIKVTNEVLEAKSGSPAPLQPHKKKLCDVCSAEGDEKTLEGRACTTGFHYYDACAKCVKAPCPFCVKEKSQCQDKLLTINMPALEAPQVDTTDKEKLLQQVKTEMDSQLAISQSDKEELESRIAHGHLLTHEEDFKLHATRKQWAEHLERLREFSIMDKIMGEEYFAKQTELKKKAEAEAEMKKKDDLATRILTDPLTGEKTTAKALKDKLASMQRQLKTNEESLAEKEREMMEIEVNQMELEKKLKDNLERAEEKKQKLDAFVKRVVEKARKAKEPEKEGEPEALPELKVSKEETEARLKKHKRKQITEEDEDEEEDAKIEEKKEKPKIKEDPEFAAAIAAEEKLMEDADGEKTESDNDDEEEEKKKKKPAVKPLKKKLKKAATPVSKLFHLHLDYVKAEQDPEFEQRLSHQVRMLSYGFNVAGLPLAAFMPKADTKDTALFPTSEVLDDLFAASLFAHHLFKMVLCQDSDRKSTEKIRLSILRSLATSLNPRLLVRIRFYDMLLKLPAEATNWPAPLNTMQGLDLIDTLLARLATEINAECKITANSTDAFLIKFAAQLKEAHQACVANNKAAAEIIMKKYTDLRAEIKARESAADKYGPVAVLETAVLLCSQLCVARDELASDDEKVLAENQVKEYALYYALLSAYEGTGMTQKSKSYKSVLDVARVAFRKLGLKTEGLDESCLDSDGPKRHNALHAFIFSEAKPKIAFQLADFKRNIGEQISENFQPKSKE